MPSLTQYIKRRKCALVVFRGCALLVFEYRLVVTVAWIAYACGVLGPWYDVVVFMGFTIRRAFVILPFYCVACASFSVATRNGANYL